MSGNAPKSPLELLALADVREGSMIRAWAVGPDAPRALAELEHLLDHVRKRERTGAPQGRDSLQGGAP